MYRKESNDCEYRVVCRCKKYFCNRQSLLRHRKVCGQKKETPVFKCHLCDKEFSTKQKMNQHIDNKICQKKDKPIFKCPLCDREFSSKQMMNKHINNKSCKKPTRCSYCKKEFFSNFNLRRHPCSPHFCGSERWHKQRCTMKYDFGDMRCGKCEYLLQICPCDNKELVLMKKERDSLLYRFDEEMPWEYQWWWNQVCQFCGGPKKELRHLECIREKYIKRLRSWFYDKATEEEQEDYEANYYCQNGELEYLREKYDGEFYYPQPIGERRKIRNARAYLTQHFV